MRTTESSPKKFPLRPTPATAHLPLPGSFKRLILGLFTLLSILMCPASALAQAPPLDGWNDQRLLDRGELAFQQGDCMWARRLWRTLLDRDTHPHVRAAALYNTALCFERDQLLEEAAQAYQDLVALYPESPAVPDAHFRHARVLDALGRHPEAQHVLETLLKEEKALNPAAQRAVRLEIAWSLLMQGERKAALKRLKVLENELNGLEPDVRAAERSTLAKLELSFGLLLSELASEQTFDPARVPFFRSGRRWGQSEQAWLSARLTQRKETVRAARARFDAVLAYRLPALSMIALYGMGADLERLFRDMNGASVPTSLTAEQAAVYRKTLAEKTRPYLVEASLRYHQAHLWAVGWDQRGRVAKWLAREVERVEGSGVESLLQRPPPPPVGKAGLEGR